LTAEPPSGVKSHDRTAADCSEDRRNVVRLPLLIASLTISTMASSSAETRGALAMKQTLEARVTAGHA